jgi:hypothetical protein
MAAWYSLSELPSRKWSEADWVVGMVDVISFGYWLVCYWGERVGKINGRRANREWFT